MLAVGAGCCTSFRNIAQKEPQKNEEKHATINHIKNATVALILKEEELAVYCGGVWIGENRILTANHCAEVFGRSFFQLPEEFPYDAVGDVITFINNVDYEKNEEIPSEVAWLGIVSSVDKTHDLATIQVLSATSAHTIVNLTNEAIFSGKEIQTFGHKIGLAWSYDKGVVSSTRKMQGPTMGDVTVETKVLQISAPVWVGNSGGGAFDEKGNLLGICSWVTLRAPNVSFFIHKEEIENFLKKSLQ